MPYADIEKKKLVDKQYHVLHKDKINARSIAWRLANKDRQREHGRRHNFFKKYGMSLADYETLFVKQLGKCAICGTKNTAPWGYFSVDHNHCTGKVRGLLCMKCNTCIGMSGDDPKILRKAARYLSQ